MYNKFGVFFLTDVLSVTKYRSKNEAVLLIYHLYHLYLNHVTSI